MIFNQLSKVTLSNKYVLFVLLWVILLLFYSPSFQAGMVTDFTGWSERFLTHGWNAFLIPWNYGSFQPFYQLSFSIFYSLFGFQTLYWSLAFITLHAICATLLMLFFTKFSTHLNLQLSPILLFSAGLIWAVNPYHTDVVVFKVCQHYMLCFICILMSLLLFLRFQKTRKHRLRLVGGIGVMTLFSLFFKEFGYMIPFMIIVIGMSRTGLKTVSKIWLLLPAVFSSTIAIIIYWIWKSIYFPFGFTHENYTNVNYTDISSLISTVEKYFFKYLLFTRHFSHNWKHDFNEALSQYGLWIALIILLFGLGYFFIKNRITPHDSAIAGTFSLAILGWIPVATLYFSYILLGENNRFGYVGSAFFVLFLVTLCSRLPKFWRYLILVAYLLISCYFLYNMNQKWGQNEVVKEALIEDFRWMEAEKVYILSIPNNYHGIYLFRTGHTSPSTFYDHLKWIEGKEPDGEFIEVNQYNMMSLDDGVNVQKRDSLHWYVEFKQWGNWSWKAYQGATDYSTDEYSVEYKGNGYHIYFNQKPEDAAVYIYQDGLRWKKVEY